MEHIFDKIILVDDRVEATEEEKVIGIYPLDMVTESDIEALYIIRLEEEKIRNLVIRE